jgi:hypothetical protein
VKRFILPLLIVLSLLLASCSAPAPVIDPPTATPTTSSPAETAAPTNPAQPSPTAEATAEPTPTQTPQPTQIPSPTLEPTPTTVPTPAATPFGQTYTVEAGGYEFQAPNTFRVNISTTTATLTHSVEDLVISVTTEELRAGTTPERALATLVDRIGPTIDAIEAGPSFRITVDGIDGLAADVVGLREGEPFAGQIFVVEISAGHWFTGTAFQDTDREGQRWSVPSRDLTAAFLRSVEFTSN